jgi:RNA polymerase sigma-70 factor, ECF subfamily
MLRFEQIYAEHPRAVRAYVRRRAPEAVVDDVVSETFLVCLRKIDRVPTEPLPWLYTVARKTLANERRKRARVAHRHEVLAVEPAPVGDGGLAAAFNALSERDREVLICSSCNARASMQVPQSPTWAPRRSAEPVIRSRW